MSTTPTKLLHYPFSPTPTGGAVSSFLQFLQPPQGSTRRLPGPLPLLLLPHPLPPVSLLPVSPPLPLLPPDERPSLQEAEPADRERRHWLQETDTRRGCILWVDRDDIITPCDLTEVRGNDITEEVLKQGEAEDDHSADETWWPIRSWLTDWHYNSAVVTFNDVIVTSQRFWI